jgi:hypothetical protein
MATDDRGFARSALTRDPETRRLDRLDEILIHAAREVVGRGVSRIDVEEHVPKNVNLRETTWLMYGGDRSLVR